MLMTPGEMDQTAVNSLFMQVMLVRGQPQVAVQLQVAGTAGATIQTITLSPTITVKTHHSMENHVSPTESVHRLFGRTLIHSHTVMNSQ